MVEFFNRFRRYETLFWVMGLAMIAVAATELSRRHVSRRFHRPHHQQAPRNEHSLAPEPFRRWRERFLALNSERDRDGLFRGIFLGDDSSIPRDTKDLFLDAGLAHVLAASGYNCWITALIVGLLAQLTLYALSSQLPSPLALGARLRIENLAQLGGAWLFWLWSDQSAPITRAAVMVSLKIALDALSLRASFPRLLLVLYALSLAVDPALWRNASFQLTYGCLFGLVLVPPLLDRFRPKRLDVVWTYLTASLGACLGAIPTTLICFGEANFNSLMTNWFATPLTSLIVMPCGIGQMALLVLPDCGATRAALHALGWLGTLGTSWLVHALHVWESFGISLRLS